MHCFSSIDIILAARKGRIMTLMTLFALSLLGTLWLRATTHYIVEADRLLIRRAGFNWMEILFRDVEEIQHRSVFFDKLCQVRMYQLGFRKMLRIRRRRGFHYVLINPRDPAPIIDAFYRFSASLVPEAPEQSGQALPDFLRHTR